MRPDTALGVTLYFLLNFDMEYLACSPKSNIGDAMANAFRFTYWRIFCYLCTKKPKKRRRQRNISRHSRGYVGVVKSSLPLILGSIEIQG